jgi:hypothetical protein
MSDTTPEAVDALQSLIRHNIQWVGLQDVDREAYQQADDTITALRSERDQWASMVGHIVACLPLKDIVPASATMGELIDAIKSGLAERDALRSQLATARADAVRVKPLVWEDMGGYWRAKSCVGEYEAGWEDGAWAANDGPSMWEWRPEEDPRGLSEYNAKAAAQADYEARIIAALEPSPSAPSLEAVARAAMQWAAWYLEMEAKTYGAHGYSFTEVALRAEAGRIRHRAADDPTIAAIITKAGGAE